MKLYRGENIQKGNEARVDLLKKFLRHGFPTDLINGGNPYRPQQLGFFDSTVKHIADNCLGVGSNAPKHFLSFSSDKGKAEHYATHFFESGKLKQNSYELLDAYYTRDLNSYRDESIWGDTQHLLIELDISNGVESHSTAPFAKILTYNGGKNKLLAWDAVAFLKMQLSRIGTPSQKLLDQFPGVIPKIQTALGYATTDSEWLVASLDLIPPQTGVPPSFSAIFPHSEILEVKHHVDPEYFVR